MRELFSQKYSRRDEHFSWNNYEFIFIDERKGKAGGIFSLESDCLIDNFSVKNLINECRLRETFEIKLHFNDIMWYIIFFELLVNDRKGTEK
jgi:hypothetical protein